MDESWGLISDTTSYRKIWESLKDLCLGSSDHYDCQGACPISEQYYEMHYQSRGLKTPVTNLFACDVFKFKNSINHFVHFKHI